MRHVAGSKATAPNAIASTRWRARRRNTGTKADHRLLLRASDIGAFARAVAAQLGVAGAAGGSAPESAQTWLGPLVKDLQDARGRSLVIAGEGQPPAVHALAHAMNDALGNVGSTVVYTQTVETHPMDQRAGLAELVGEMNAGTVSLLLILGGNPVYTAPSDLKFAEAMDKVPLRANLGQFHDETAALCHWHIPETHFLEMWSDVRGHDGTASIVQPLIAPLYNGHSVHEVVSTLSAAGVRSGYDIVRSYWSGQKRCGTCCGRTCSSSSRSGRDAGAAAWEHHALAVRPRLAAMAARRRDSGHGVCA